MGKEHRINRRQFVARASRLAAGVLSFPQVVPSAAIGKSGTAAPSNRIVIGCIGLGIQGTGNMREFLRQPDVQVAAVCDVRQSQRRKAKEIVDRHYGNKDCTTHGDFRQITGSEKIDAVMIAAPDH